MPSINRRQVLRSLAASSAAAATLAASTIPAAPAQHPDVELFRLDQEMEAAHARMERASKASRRAGRKCEKLYPPKPPKWEEPRMPDHLVEMTRNMVEMTRNMPLGDFRRPEKERWRG
jgi:hypothetical protein